MRPPTLRRAPDFIVAEQSSHQLSPAPAGLFYRFAEADAHYRCAPRRSVLRCQIYC
jgi:hypothetical protein